MRLESKSDGFIRPAHSARRLPGRTLANSALAPPQVSIVSTPLKRVLARFRFSSFVEPTYWAARAALDFEIEPASRDSDC